MSSIIVLSSFCFYSIHIDSFISRVARYTPFSAINLSSNKIQKIVQTSAKESLLSICRVQPILYKIRQSEFLEPT